MEGLLPVYVMCLVLGIVTLRASAMRPNIVVVVADDLGWGDVSYHGSEEIHTPNIDALATDGIALDSYYVSPMCSPSRATLLSGRHPIHTGLQHNVIYSAQPYALPLHFKLMPEHLKTLGYETHAIGKWHIGHMTRTHTPTQRGFDSFYGYYGGHHGYTDHTCFEVYRENEPGGNWSGWGLDLWENLQADRSKTGKETTELFTEKAVEILKYRNQDKPFFIYLSHLAVHVGNEYAMFEPAEKYMERNSHIQNPKRRKLAATLSALDDSVGNLVEALNATGAIENTILVLTTDNGAAAGGIDNSAGSNWPLRGTKMTHWEGGVRGTAFVWSPMIRTPRVSRQLMHVSDWLPTLYSAAGGNVEDLGDIDGVDMWHSLVSGAGSPRSEVLHNIDPVWNMSALRVGSYKYVQGTYGGGNFDGWYKPAAFSAPCPPAHEAVSDVSENGLNYVSKSGFSITVVDKKVTQCDYVPFNKFDYASTTLERRKNFLDLECSAARIARGLGRWLPSVTPEELHAECGQVPVKDCKPLQEPCLFNIHADPCERENIAEENPQIVRKMAKRLEEYRKTMVPPLNKPPTRRADPRYFDYTWAPYMDSLWPYV
ncbi:arylsulfatase B-like [Haemaphysalis longicornis]